MSQGSYRLGTIAPADIVTYRHGDKLVYVKPAETYELALDIAQKEFAEDLANVPRDRIGFAVLSTFGAGDKRPVRISESAWPGAVSRLLRGEIIDVYIRADPQSKEFKDIPPPQYLDIPKITLNEAAGTSGGGRQARSNPTSRAGSPSHRDNRRSWFGGNPR